MSDEADRADAHTERWLAECLARAGCGVGKGAEHCADCGEPIPPARRQAYPMAIRCIECQERAER